MAGSNIEPFKVSVPEAELHYLRRRLQQTRWPDAETVGDWSQGVPLKEIRDLTNYWETQYDWRVCESWLNSNGQHIAHIDGRRIHFLHIRSCSPDALPLLLLHGWPGSVLEFRKVVEQLTAPGPLAFHVIIPSLPGYGFSPCSEKFGMNLKLMARILGRLMLLLGYDRWVAQGGDWGADLCAVLASQNPPKSLAGVHMNTPFFDARKEIGSSVSISAAEKLALEKQEAFEKDEYGYFKLQATRPQTIGYSLADSPVGQAAWIFEKLQAWSQHNGSLYEVFTKDEILDNIMLYWLTNTGVSSARLYWEDDDGVDMPISIPVGMTVFPGDLVYAPRLWGERYYSNIIHWNEAKKGGHFAAWEVPEIFIEELRQCFKHLRQ